MRLKPLVVLMSEALEAPSAGDRNRGLQRLGDVSLFIAGFFAQGFARKLIDIDYHIAMGGRAYGTLADLLARGRGRVLGQVFAELAEKFQPMVDALNEVSETSHRHTDEDILRLYEIWLKTGSRALLPATERAGRRSDDDRALRARPLSRLAAYSSSSSRFLRSSSSRISLMCSESLRRSRFAAGLCGPRAGAGRD